MMVTLAILWICLILALLASWRPVGGGDAGMASVARPREGSRQPPVLQLVIVIASGGPSATKAVPHEAVRETVAEGGEADAVGHAAPWPVYGPSFCRDPGAGHRISCASEGGAGDGPLQPAKPPLLVLGADGVWASV